MIITTSINKNKSLIEKALSLSLKYNIEYRPRQGMSLNYLLENIDPRMYVVNNMRGLTYYEQGMGETFFHPNMAFQRIFQLKKGQRDNMAAACKLESGMLFFDGTLGLAADSLTASYVVGKSGKVAAAENSLPIYILVKEGLKFYAEQYPDWASVIERISIANADNLDIMRTYEDKSFDVAYFDFMFNRPLTDSSGIQGIRHIACYDAIKPEHIHEALRIARTRVVVKSDYNGAKLLLKYGFRIEKERQRKNFYYAVLEK